MAACRFECSVRLRVSPEVAYAFHLDPANLRRISPPWAPLRRLEVPPVLIPGSLVNLETWVLGFWPQRWQVEIVDLVPPERLVDVARRSPFRSWRHVHAFRRVGTETEMTDQVDYDPPLGRLSQWIDPWVTRPALAALFRFRHTRTRELLETGP